MQSRMRSKTVCSLLSPCVVPWLMPLFQEEEQLFFQRIHDVGIGNAWGVFAMEIPGRTGYQCSNFYRCGVRARACACCVFSALARRCRGNIMRRYDDIPIWSLSIFRGLSGLLSLYVMWYVDAERIWNVSYISFFPILTFFLESREVMIHYLIAWSHLVSCTHVGALPLRDTSVIMLSQLMLFAVKLCSSSISSRLSVFAARPWHSIHLCFGIVSWTSWSVTITVILVVAISFDDLLCLWLTEERQILSFYNFGYCLLHWCWC